MIELARYYIAKGWPIFPLVPGGKVPAISKERGGHGCNDATLDPKRVEGWWGDRPRANVGIATGRRSGLLVVDIDPRSSPDWLKSVSELALPKSFTVRTASGGFHVYFALPSDSNVGSGAGLLAGVDWRANGGYVVSPGSIVNGTTYLIERKIAITPAPQHLLDRIAAHGSGPRVAARDDNGRMVIPESQRNAQMTRIAGALRRFGVDFNAIFESLRAISADHCEPALDDDELRAVAASVSRYMPDGAGAQQRGAR